MRRGASAPRIAGSMSLPARFVRPGEWVFAACVLVWLGGATGPYRKLLMDRDLVTGLLVVSLLLLAWRGWELRAWLDASWPLLLPVAVSALSPLWSCDPRLSLRAAVALDAYTAFGLWLALRFDASRSTPIGVCRAGADHRGERAARSRGSRARGHAHGAPGRLAGAPLPQEQLRAPAGARRARVRPVRMCEACGPSLVGQRRRARARDARSCALGGRGRGARARRRRSLPGCGAAAARAARARARRTPRRGGARPARRGCARSGSDAARARRTRRDAHAAHRDLGAARRADPRASLARVRPRRVLGRRRGESGPGSQSAIRSGVRLTTAFSIWRSSWGSSGSWPSVCRTRWRW